MATIITKLWQNKVPTAVMISSIGVLIALLVGYTKTNTLSSEKDEKGNVQINSDTKKSLLDIYRISMFVMAVYIVFALFIILRS